MELNLPTGVGQVCESGTTVGADGSNPANQSYRIVQVGDSTVEIQQNLTNLIVGRTICGIWVYPFFGPEQMGFATTRDFFF
jgi:hypothetical protein